MSARVSGRIVDPSRFPFHVLEGMNTRKENRIFFENVVDKRPRPFYARSHAHTMDGPLEKKVQKSSHTPLRGAAAFDILCGVDAPRALRCVARSGTVPFREDRPDRWTKP